MHVHCNAKNCVLIAAILSELHAPRQPVMQGYVIGLTTLNTVSFVQNHHVRSKVKGYINATLPACPAPFSQYPCLLQPLPQVNNKLARSLPLHRTSTSCSPWRGWGWNCKRRPGISLQHNSDGWTVHAVGQRHVTPSA